MIVLGCAIYAFGVNQLILPVHLMSGGLTGISILLNHFVHWTVGDWYFVLNIPLLVLGYMYVGGKFSIYTIIAVTLTTVFLDVLHVDVTWTKDPLLCAVFGGVLSGLGGALVLRAGGSSGGLDIIARIVAKYHNVSMGRFGLIVNSFIILVSLYLFQVPIAMFTLISIYTSMRVYDAILNHMDRITVMIVTDKGPEMTHTITHSMTRGITRWEAYGGYTQNEKSVLMCVVVNVQLGELKHLALSVDPDAFMTVIPTRSVVGHFTQIW